MSDSGDQMAHDDSEAAAEINRLESSQKAPAPLSGQLIERAKRRRVDLRTLHGVARESAKIYKGLSTGQLQPAQAEIRSRVLRRHSEILSTLQVEELGRRLEQLQQLPAPQLADAEVQS